MFVLFKDPSYFSDYGDCASNKVHIMNYALCKKQD